MDFDAADLLRKIAFTAKFTRKGKVVFESVMFAGTLGLYTGIKHGKFAISIN